MNGQRRRFLGLMLVVGAGLECRSTIRTPLPQGSACGEIASAPLLHLTKTHRLQPQGIEAVLALRIDGTSVSDGTATFCIEADSALLYRDIWKTWWWWHGPDATESTNGDSTVRAVAARFFNETAFGRLEEFDLQSSSWVDNPAFDQRAAIAENVKETEYWRAHGLVLGTPLSNPVRDSLSNASVDSNLVNAVASSLVREHPTTFAYWLGEENGMMIAWWNGGRQFITIKRH